MKIVLEIPDKIAAHADELFSCQLDTDEECNIGPLPASKEWVAFLAAWSDGYNKSNAEKGITGGEMENFKIIRFKNGRIDLKAAGYGWQINIAIDNTNATAPSGVFTVPVNRQEDFKNCMEQFIKDMQYLISDLDQDIAGKI